MNSRLLILAYSFPPDIEVGSQRPARFCRYLPEYGIDPIVMSIREEYYASLDQSLALPNTLKVERTGVIRNPLRLYGAMKMGLRRGDASNGVAHGRNTAAPSRQGKKLGFRDHAIACFQIPDRYWGWYWPALRRAGEIIRSERISAILSTSPPVTAHLIARSLKLKFGIPWIADFRDPWRDSRSAEQIPSWSMRISERLKHRCVESADRIVCNTDRLRTRMIAEFPALSQTRFVTLTNGFDIEIEGLTFAESGGRGARDGSVTFLHIGTLYGDRRIDGLVCALERLREQQVLQQQVKFIFLGPEQEAAREQVLHAAPELLENGTIEFRSRVPRSQLQGIMKAADVLLLVQGDYELQIPAKFYEYLPTGLPMLAITKPGALSDIVNTTESGVCAGPDDVEAISTAIERVLKMPRKSRAEVAGKFGKYHYRELTGRLAGIVREVSACQMPKGHLPTTREASETQCASATRELEKR